MQGRRWVLVASTLAAATGAGADTSRAISYGTPVPRPEFGRPRQMLVADVTGDGQDDLIAVSAEAPRVTVFPGRGDGAFDAPFGVATSVLPGAVHAARLNEDAALDLVVDRADRGGIDVLLSDGRGGLALTTVPASPAPNGSYGPSESSSAADWDGDGKLDLVSLDAQHVLRVRLGDGAGGFGAAQTTLRGDDEGFVLAADLDGDGRTDLATFGQSVHVSWRQPDGSLSASVFVGWTASITGLCRAFDVGDVDGDGLTDLVALSWAMDPAGSGRPGVVTVFHRDALRSFARETQYRYAGAATPSSVAVRDLNDDGRPEIVTPHAVFVNRGDGTFGAPFKLPATGACLALLEGTDDGRLDVLVAGDLAAALVPVVPSTAAPTLTSISPAIHPGAERLFTFTCSGVSPDAEFDFGDGFRPPGPDPTGEVRLQWTQNGTPTSFDAWLVVRPDAAPGARTVTVRNPDGATASAPYEIVAGGDAQVFSMTPSSGRPGDRVSVVVRGRNFVEDVGVVVPGRAAPGVPLRIAAQTAGGVLVVESRLVSPGELRLVLDVGASAAPGPRALFVTNGTGVPAAYEGIFSVLPPRTIDLVARSGVFAPAAGRGVFAASGRLAFNERSADRAFDPRTETAEIRLGDMTAPLVVSVPAGDGWRVRGRRATWTSPRGASPRVRLVLDFGAQTFRLDVSRFDRRAPASDEVLVELTLGDETGSSVSTWTRRSDERLELRPSPRPRRAR